MRKSLIALICTGLLVLVTFGIVQAQNPLLTNLPPVASSGDIAYSRAFNNWSVRVTQGNASTGSSTITLSQGLVTISGGLVIGPFATTAPITIIESGQTETVTPTAVSNCGGGQIPGQSCLITASFTYVHGTGATVTSGTYGVQEAINYLHTSTSGGQVVVASNFPGTISTITAATGYVDTKVTWNHSGYPDEFVWNGATYVLNPSANLTTVTLANPTALTNLMTQTQVAGQQNSAGRITKVEGVGFASAGTGGTATVRAYLLVGTVPVCDITSAALANSAANYPFKFSATLVTSTTGATGTVEAHCDLGLASATSGTTATMLATGDANVTASTIDLTAANTIALQGMFSASVASSRLAQRYMSVRYLN